MENHVLGIYKEAKMLHEAISFLAKGWHNNESIAIVSQKWDKKTARKQLQNALDETQIGQFEDDRSIIISTVTDWYMSNGKLNPDMIIKKWKDFVTRAEDSGKKGVRVFVDASYFFEKGYKNDLLDYEKTLPQKFDVSINAICAYSFKDIAKFDQASFEILRAHHGKTILKGIELPKPSSAMIQVKEPTLRMIILDAFGDSIKNKIIRCLMQKPMDGKVLAKCVCKPNTTFYRKLHELVNDGIITDKHKSGKTKKYRVIYSAMMNSLEQGKIKVYVK